MEDDKRISLLEKKVKIEDEVRNYKKHSSIKARNKDDI